MDTTIATGETTYNFPEPCHSECVHKAEQAAPCDKSVHVDSRLASAAAEKDKWKRQRPEKPDTETTADC